MGAESPASTSSRNAFVWGSSVASKAKSRELPASAWREEVAVGGAAMTARCGAACAFQNILAAHELAVVLADGSFGLGKTGVGSEGALRPFPDVAEDSAAGTGNNSGGIVELIADQRIGGGAEVLPFGFGREACAGPAGERVRFKIADVRDGSRPVDLAASTERELRAILAPVQRGDDAFLLHPCPAFREPQRGRRIAAIVDELAPFLVGDAAAGDLMAGKEDAVARAFGIEGEGVIWRSDLDDPLAAAMPGKRLNGEAGGRRQLTIGRFERVFGEGREDIGQEKLLMLLLVIDAELDELQCRRRKARKSALQRFVNVSAIGANLVERGTAKHSPLRARVPWPFCLVIAVEQEAPILVEWQVSRRVIPKDEGLEEPGGMREVPFGRRGIREGLNRRVGIAERRGEIERQLAGGEQLLAQRPEGRSRILPGHWRDALPPNGSRGQLKVL